MIAISFFFLMRVLMNAFRISIIVMSLFSLALTMLVKMTESVATVSKLAILLGVVCALLITYSHSLDLDFPVSLLLKEHVGLHHHLTFFVGQITPMHGN